MDLSNYKPSCISLHGVDNIFKLCHIPFLTYADVFGALALEGSSGTGKTTLIERIGILNKAATGGDVGVFSADKARYEDFIGCPIPNKDTQRMDMYPMEHAVATKETLLIDEINRAEYSNQEKWMSLLSSRKIDGHGIKCKYLYVAMNPVMSEDNDIYEGVQPLDKAVGERISGILRMRRFNELDKLSQVNIIKSLFNQTKWQPTEEAVELHTAYVNTTREYYAEYKGELTDIICEYIYNVSKTFHTETKGQTSIEARRAQFLLSNILAVYALNTVSFGKSSLELSALEALQISFPGRLWEQPTPTMAIKQAHEQAKGVLQHVTQGTVNSVNNSLDVLHLCDTLKQAIGENTELEFTSKAINANLPDVKVNPLMHYMYSIAVIDVLNKQYPNKNQKLLKAQEYDRLSRIARKITDSEAYKNFRELGRQIKSTHNYPKGSKYPSYIYNAKSDEVLKVFIEVMKFKTGWLTAAIIEYVTSVDKFDIDLSSKDFMILVESFSTLYKTVKVILEQVDNASNQQSSVTV